MSEALGVWTTHSMFLSRSVGKATSKPLTLPWRQAARMASSVVQALGFAAIMWLLLAGPGFVSDSAGQAPATKVARR